MKLLSHVRIIAIRWTAAYQASSVRGIFQARALECGAIAFSFMDYAKAFDCVDHSKLWKIPRMEEPGGLQSMGSLRVGHA